MWPTYPGTGLECLWTKYFNITHQLSSTPTPPLKCKNVIAIFSPLKLSNLVRYVHNMMGNLIQESCDQSWGCYQKHYS